MKEFAICLLGKVGSMGDVIFNQTFVRLFDDGTGNVKIKVSTVKALREDCTQSDIGIREFIHGVDYVKKAMGVIFLEDSLKADEKQALEEDRQKERFQSNIARARSKVFELAFCNPWEYFFTLTFSPDNIDRSDRGKVCSALSAWFRKFASEIGQKIGYLFIPELHQDKTNWHIHGFLMGIPIEHLTQYEIGMPMSKSIADKVSIGQAVFFLEGLQKSFGFCEIEPIENKEAAAKYITKYISKDFAESAEQVESGVHLYYRSRDLRESKLLKKGSMSANIQPTFENEYCSVAWIPYSEEELEKILNSITNIV